MQQIRIRRTSRPRRDRFAEVLPLDPRDPDVLRAKRGRVTNAGNAPR
jgi:hypothetical protein